MNIRKWIKDRQERIAQEKRMEMQKTDKLFFSLMFVSVIEEIQSRTDCTQEQKDRMIASAKQMHEEAIESRRKLRENGKDVPIGF